MRRFEVNWLNGTRACAVTATDATGAALQAAELIATEYGMSRPPVPGSSVPHRFVGLFGPTSRELVAVVVPADLPAGLY